MNTEKLEKYCNNVLKWNKAYNLVSASQTTSQEIWQRHIEDSIQIYKFIENEKGFVVDFGSGAGFPAIPCAVLAEENNKNLNFIMIESINKKVMFLQDSIRLLGLKNIKALCERIENVKDIKADFITARAFSKIDEIFNISKNISKENTKFVLLKGKNVEEEIVAAKNKFIFKYQLIKSSTGDGFVFISDNIKRL